MNLLLLKTFSVLGVNNVLQDHPRVYIKTQNNLTLNSINSLEELKTAVLSVNTDLKKYANNLVFGDGYEKSKIMIIGEAPGADEDIQGKPFVGQSGQLLMQALQSIQLSRENVYITNIIPWRPPLNRTPTANEIAIFLPYLEKHIEIIQPKIILCTGSISSKTILNLNDGIMKIRGQWFEYKNNIKVICTFHPAYLLRSPSQKRFLWYDLMQLKIMYDKLLIDSD